MQWFGNQYKKKDVEVQCLVTKVRHVYLFFYFLHVHVFLWKTLISNTGCPEVFSRLSSYKARAGSFSLFSPHQIRQDQLLDTN